MPPAPAPLSVRVLGGGRDIGRSCLLLTLGDRRVLLDCGAHPAFADARRFPDLAALPPLDAVLVTHFHLDHAGALPLLRRLQRDAAPAGPVGGVVTPPSFPPVVMTRPTRALTQLMLRDFYDTSAARRQALPFSDADVRDALDCVAEIELDAPYSPPGAPDLRVSAFYAGHVLGAVMFRVAVRGVGCVVYSGDYTTSPDALLRAADVPVPAEPVDLFITEATYCSTIRKAPRSAAESELVSVVVRALHARGKVLIPVSALGRAHELIAVLSPLWNGEDDDLDLSHVPVYVAAGLMSKAAAIYDVHAVDWCCGTAQDPHKLRMPQLREFKRGRDWAHVVEDGPMLMFATPGNLSSFVRGAGRHVTLSLCPGSAFPTRSPRACLPAVADAAAGATASTGLAKFVAACSTCRSGHTRTHVASCAQCAGCLRAPSCLCMVRTARSPALSRGSARRWAAECRCLRRRTGTQLTCARRI
jgi:integrator complex subunit 11